MIAAEVRPAGARTWHGGALAGLLTLGTLAGGIAAAAVPAPAPPVSVTATATPAPGGAPRPPEQIYSQICATCHEGGKVPRAPHAVQFPMIGAKAILAALENGAMQAQGALLTPEERRNVAEFLGGSKLPKPGEPPPWKRCDAAHSTFDAGATPPLNGWGFVPENTRFSPPAVAKLAARDVPKLKLKWAFAFSGATRVRSQPTVGGGALYLGGQDGTIYALDFATGCVRWTFEAEAEVRNSPVLEGWKAGDRNAKPRLFLGDFKGNAYALDARSGKLLWKTRVDAHPRLTITGSPRLFEGRLYVPMSSNEWASAADPTYECCTFQGGVTALNAKDGSVLWRSYVIPDRPAAAGENAVGAKRFHPAGAPVWNSPSIDAKHRRLYVGTGEAYTSPAAEQSDAVVAFDLDSGQRLWWYQSLPHDAWNMACFIGGGPNCPRENGPDLDIGAGTILTTLPGGRDVVLAGQKSGDVMALDAASGKLVWKRKFGRGGYVGGVHWGMAFGDGQLYAPMADTTILGTEQGERKPGLNAIDPETGALKWHAVAPNACGAGAKAGCDAGYSAPPVAIAGAVFAGSFDGHVRAYAAGDGKLLWDYDTTQPVKSVSGEMASGGSIEGSGPIVANGRLVVTSGYLFGGRMPGNALLVFSVDGK